MDRIIASWSMPARPVPVEVEHRIAGSVARRTRLGPLLAAGRMMPAAVGSCAAALLLVVSVNSGLLHSRANNNGSLSQAERQKIALQSRPLIESRRTSAILAGRPAPSPSPEELRLLRAVE
ncbi:MAG: hypothetical protein ACRDFS_04380 [Chloroflexota bacterium]